MLIYFLRHANAGEKCSDPIADEKRPLDDEGISQCATMGRLLAACGAKVDAFVSSPLTRAIQTAELVAKELQFSDEPQIEDSLKPGAKEKEFRAMLQRYEKKKAIVVVGHNPNFSEFLSSLISVGSSKTGIELKKGAAAKVELTGKWSGTLLWCITPKLAALAQGRTLATKSRPKTSRK